MIQNEGARNSRIRTSQNLNVPMGLEASWNPLLSIGHPPRTVWYFSSCKSRASFAFNCLGLRPQLFFQFQLVVSAMPFIQKPLRLADWRSFYL